MTASVVETLGVLDHDLADVGLLHTTLTPSEVDQVRADASYLAMTASWYTTKPGADFAIPGKPTSPDALLPRISTAGAKLFIKNQETLTRRLTHVAARVPGATTAAAGFRDLAAQLNDLQSEIRLFRDVDPTPARPHIVDRHQRPTRRAPALNPGPRTPTGHTPRNTGRNTHQPPTAVPLTPRARLLRPIDLRRESSQRVSGLHGASDELSAKRQEGPTESKR